VPPLPSLHLEVIYIGLRIWHCDRRIFSQRGRLVCHLFVSISVLRLHEWTAGHLCFNLYLYVVSIEPLATG
jgi:hypothetical protein